MNRILKKFLQRGVDLSPVGVELREDNTNYFCTPKGASVFGWAGIDGIHFCFIRGFGEMVFSVSPMNTSPDYVHPVAENFTDFLRLILACGDVAAVEQAWMWNEAQFEAFLNENPTTQEQQQTLSEISEKMNLLPMEQPWTYIKNLQSSFDYSQIKYTEDYYDNDMTSEAELVAPEWKVYFDGDFWGHRGKDRAGKEIKLDKQFDWAGYHWVIPAAYSCSKGLVVDFCMRVDSESIRDFMKKWNLDWENDSCENFTREQQMQMEWENPLCFNFKPCLKLNEKILQTTHGCAVSFNPCLPDGVINELEAKWAIDHYGLDSTYGWVICRDVFPWGTKHHPEINKLFLTMEQQPGQVPGSHFKVHAPGDSFMFSHPVSGITHTLTVQEIEQQTVPQNSFGSDRWIYPTHYIAMSYTLTPEPMENISVFDCDEGDRPIEVTPDDHSFRPVGSSSCFVVGVIGGADGPTAVIYGTNSQEKLHAACSALHFEPVGDDVEWRIVFNVTQFDKETCGCMKNMQQEHSHWIPTSRKSRSVTDEFQRCKSKLNNQKRKNPLRALCRERYAQQRSRQKISYTGRGSQRVWCRPLSKMSLCMMEGASWYGSNMSRACRTKKFVLNTLPCSNLAPGQLGARFSLVLPMPLPPEVAKGMMVLPFKLWLSKNVLTMVGATYHQIGKPTKMMSYSSMLSRFTAMAGREVGSLISMVLRDSLSIQFKSALV